jgi:hypothetical protein
MKKTAPHVTPILAALLAGKPITEAEVNAVLRDGKPMDLQIAAVMSSRTDYGPVLMRAAHGEEPDCQHVPQDTPYGRACAKCGMRTE